MRFTAGAIELDSPLTWNVQLLPMPPNTIRTTSETRVGFNAYDLARVSHAARD